MEKLQDRFLRYVAVETTSNEESESQPSAERELDLLRMLRDELKQMGVEELVAVHRNAYDVYLENMGK